MAILDVIEAAEWLGENLDVAKLKRLKELSDNPRFYLTVWGHYSAGKSLLINNILGKDILPVQTRETTAVLTYIQYGILEECVIVYENGASSNHELSVLKDVFQNTSKFEDVSEIDHIEVYLNNDLLSTGLVMVDTPGVNTIIQKHQELAVDAIEQSGRIVYVLGNSPSSVDKQFIKKISDCGIEISFIRTKCDKFLVAEEGNPEDTLEIERNTIEGILNRKIDFVSISNIEGNKWYDNIAKVRILIRQVADSISDEMDSSIKRRLEVFVADYVQKLHVEAEHLEQVRIGNTAKIDDEIHDCENDLKIIETVVKDIEKKIDHRVDEAKSKSKKELDILINDRIDTFSDDIDQVEVSDIVPVEVNTIFESHLSSTIEVIQELLNTYFEEIIRDEINDLIGNISDKSFNISVPTYAEVQQDNSRILEMYNSKLSELKQTIETIKKEQILNGDVLSEVETNFDEDDYNEALALLNQELSEIPSEMALRPADNQRIQPSSVFKAIGTGVDLLLLLVPGEAVFKGIKGVANTTKIAQTLHKTGKAGEVILKAGKSIGKNANAIDKVRDTAYTLNQVLGKRRYSTKAEREMAEKIVVKTAEKGQEVFEKFKEEKKSGNVIDVLSVAYWTEKLGKNFDSKPRMEVDREEEERRKELRNQISEQQQQLINEKINKKKQLGVLQDKAAELKLREQEEELKKKRIEEEMKKQAQIVTQQARISALNKYKCEFKEYYGKCITCVANDIMMQYFSVASQNITMYIARQSKEAIDAMESKKNQLEEMCLLKKKTMDDITCKIEKNKEISKKLEMISL